MRFLPTLVEGCYIVVPDLIGDDRGGFARVFCADEFATQGLEPAIVQCSVSVNPIGGTLRGLHRQRFPHAEAKLVRCTRGALFDVALDMRPDSRSVGQHVAVELTEDNRQALYVPPYVFHGFQTLADDTEIVYAMSGRYVADAEDTCRYDDPVFGIRWPRPVTVISARDAQAPSWDPLPTDP